MQALESSYPGSLALISGGARSGKSRFALELAINSGTHRLFIATAQAWDAEMQTRISAHQVERGKYFHTLEEPLDLERALQAHSTYDVILIDCLTLWISNHLMREDWSDAMICSSIVAGVQAARQRARHTILVSNEVGFGIVPDNALARRFRDLNGRLQQDFAATASKVYLAVLGQILPLHALRVDMKRSL